MGRPPALASHGMVATSSPNATRAGLRALERGGNAADAAVAAGAMLCVTEPMNAGMGGDVFALISDGERFYGLDAAGPAPRRAEPAVPVAQHGPRSVTVPGAIAGWAALCERFGVLGLDACLADAIDAAENGVVVSERSSALWSSERRCPAEFGPVAPRAGETVKMPAMAATMRLVARDGPPAIYTGQVADSICSVTWLAADDLEAYRARWVEPLRASYKGYMIMELPPPTQGIAVLEALTLLAGMEPNIENQIASVTLALEDAARYVRDEADVSLLLEPEYIGRRLTERAGPVLPVDAGTSHVAVVDSSGLAVSFIESLFHSFGSGVLAPSTGIILQNRGACFEVAGAISPGQRPFHTIIPAMMHGGDDLLAAFGVVGGHLQAQAHVQLVSALVDAGLDPQAALDRPRFRVEGATVMLEEGLWDKAQSLRALGFDIRCVDDWTQFGSGQFAAVADGFLIGASDPRMDGYAAGL